MTASTGALYHPLIIASSNSINFWPRKTTQHNISTQDSNIFPFVTNLKDILPRRFCVSYFYFTFVLCFSFHRILLSHVGLGLHRFKTPGSKQSVATRQDNCCLERPILTAVIFFHSLFRSSFINFGTSIPSFLLRSSDLNIPFNPGTSLLF